MKKVLFTALFVLAAAGMASAQNCMIVDSEKVFKSLDEYNNALITLDKLAADTQAEVDRRFAEVETLYTNYMAQKASMSAQMRQMHEEAILTREKEANDYQQEMFGQEGTLMKKRLETIHPIQQKVFTTIETYAKAHGYDIALDSANNPMLLYTNTRVDHTQQIIDALK